MKNNKTLTTTILTTLVCLIPIIIAGILYPSLPDQVVTHWDGAGNPNGWQSKFVGTIVFPGVLVIVNLFFPVLLKIDPKYNNMDNKIKTLCHWIIPAVSLFCSLTTLSSAIGKQVPVARIAPAFLGLLFIAIGNYLPKAVQSYTVGIKLPWTLNNEENWNRTHRMAGPLWILGGFLIIIISLLNLPSALITVPAVCMILIPCVYSYLLYRKGF